MPEKRTSAARKRNRAAEAQVLNAPLSELAQHHAAARELASDEYVARPDAANLDINVALQQILMGQNNLLANDEQFRKELSQLRARMEKLDKAQARFEADRSKYVEGVFDQAEKLKVTGDRLERLKAKAGQQLTQEIQNAKAKRASDRLAFVDLLKRGKQRTVTSPGVVEMRSIRGVATPTLVPEIVRIKDLTWTFEPNVPTKVPEPVAKVLDQRRRSQAETAERKALLSADRLPSQENLQHGMRQIDKKYNSPSEAFPLA